MKNKKTKPAIKAVTDLSVAELREAVATHTVAIDAHKAEMETLQAELRRRFESRLTEHLASLEKHHGQHTFEVDGIKLTAEITARRDWDSDKLKAIARTMPFDQVERMFTIKFSVPEKVYAGIRDEKLLDALIDARTVKYSDPKITFAS